VEESGGSIGADVRGCCADIAAVSSISTQMALATLRIRATR
jgi:hypothetical protein